MATKKKTTKKAAKKPAKAKKTPPKKAAKKSAAKKIATPKKRPVLKLTANRVAKPAAKASAPKIKPANKTVPAARRVSTRGKREITDSVDFEPKGLGARSAGQSGDLQGLSNVAGADSESVDELLEEGNAFEAEVVKGVQDVPDADEGEIVTHEVPEDDVPREYDEQ
jgi:hypothetical protein